MKTDSINLPNFHSSQPDWILSLAVSHFSDSLEPRLAAQTRARHRRKFLEYVAALLPLLGLEAVVERLKGYPLPHGGSRRIDAEGEAIVRALAGKLAGG